MSNVTRDEGILFYELYVALLSFVNRKLNVTTEQFSDPPEYIAASLDARIDIRDALFENRDLIDQFIAENPAQRSVDELEIVGTWKHAVFGKFFVFRYLTNYTVFLSSDETPNRAYGVLGLADPMKKIMGPSLPRLVETALLPLRGQIIYDGLVVGYDISSGSRGKREINEEYKQAKEAFGIITSLGDQPNSDAGQSKRGGRKPAKARPRASERSKPNQAKAIAEGLIQMTDSFCKEYLNEEYMELCRKLAMALARKRPSPLRQGRPESWASGIVRTIGWVNFLDDPSQDPHLKFSVIDRAFGVAANTGQGKSKAIRTMLDIRTFDTRWTLPSQMDDNPTVWMLQVDGFVMDIRNAPRELQEMAFEKGLIPYIPADRDS